MEFANSIGRFYQLLLCFLLKVVHITSQIPFSKSYIIPPEIWQIILYEVLIFGMGYVVKTKRIKKVQKYKKQIIAIIIVIVFLSNSFTKVSTQKLRLFFVDVGQGDTSLLLLPKGTSVLVDGGGSETYDIRKKQINTILVT